MYCNLALFNVSPLLIAVFLEAAAVEKLAEEAKKEVEEGTGNGRPRCKILGNLCRLTKSYRIAF